MGESFSSKLARLNAIQDDENTKDHLLKMKERVIWLCLHRPYVKGSYAGLTQAYWRIFCGLKISASDFEKLIRAPSPDSISRIYRFVCKDASGSGNEARIYPSDHKRQKRLFRENVIREIAREGLE
jgi:hypothetical protein